MFAQHSLDGCTAVNDEEAAERALAAPARRTKIRGGFSAPLAEIPVMRQEGPLRRIVNLHGDVISCDCRAHPYGVKPGPKVGAWQSVTTTLNGAS